MDEFDSQSDAESKRDEIDSNDPTSRVYRVVRRIDQFTFEVI